MDFLQLADAQQVEGELLVECLALALADLPQEVLFEADLGGMHPLARRRPVDVARRNLRLRHERDAAIAEIGEADRIPPRDGLRLPRLSKALDVFCAVAVTIDSIMKPVLGTPTGSGVFPTGGMATQTPIEKMFGKAGLRWCLSARMKPRGLVRPSIPRTASTPRNAGSSIENANGSSCFALSDPSSFSLLDMHRRRIDL